MTTITAITRLTIFTRMRRLLALTVLLCLAPHANAFTNVIVKVTLQAAPACNINDNKLIEVNFGQVVNTRVDGSDEYLKPINYTLQCDNAPTNAMKMMLVGNGSPFDNDVLLTTVDDLGLELHANGRKQPINGWINFTYPDKPLLEVVPVKRSGATLPTGKFYAGATLKVEYQ